MFIGSVLSGPGAPTVILHSFDTSSKSLMKISDENKPFRIKVKSLLYFWDVVLPLGIITLPKRGGSAGDGLNTLGFTPVGPLLVIHNDLLQFQFFYNLYREKVNSCAAEKQAVCSGIFGEALHPQLGAWRPWRFQNEKSIDFGFSIRNSGWIPFHLSVSQMVWMGKWPSRESLFIKCGENCSISEARCKNSGMEPFKSSRNKNAAKTIYSNSGISIKLA